MKRNYVYLFILIMLFKGYFNGADKENSNEVPVNDKEIFQELKESNSIGRKHETEVKEYTTKQNTFNHYTEDNEGNQEYLNHNNAQSWFNNTEPDSSLIKKGTWSFALCLVIHLPCLPLFTRSSMCTRQKTHFFLSKGSSNISLLTSISLSSPLSKA